MSGRATVQTQTITMPPRIPVASGLIQRAATNSSSVNDVLAIVHEMLRSPDQPLDAGTRAALEPHFDHQFNIVRVHTDAKVAESVQGYMPRHVNREIKV